MLYGGATLGVVPSAPTQPPNEESKPVWVYFEPFQVRISMLSMTGRLTGVLVIVVTFAGRGEPISEYPDGNARLFVLDGPGTTWPTKVKLVAVALGL